MLYTEFSKTGGRVTGAQCPAASRMIARIQAGEFAL